MQHRTKKPQGCGTSTKGFKMTVTKQELFQMQAPNFNFEYNADQILEIALDRKFVVAVEDKEDCYLINDDY